MLVFFFASDHSQAARGSHVTTGVYVTAAPTVNTTKKWQERGLSLSALIKQYRSQLAASKIFMLKYCQKMRGELLYTPKSHE